MIDGIRTRTTWDTTKRVNHYTTITVETEGVEPTPEPRSSGLQPVALPMRRSLLMVLRIGIEPMLSRLQRDALPTELSKRGAV